MQEKQKRILLPSRQVIRGQLFDKKYDELRRTDFQGEPAVRIRSNGGDALIHGPANSVLRAMARDWSKRQFKLLADDARARASAPINLT